MRSAQNPTDPDLHRLPVSPRARWGRVAVDAHVHLRGDIPACLSAAARNFAAAGDRVDAGAILLTESEGNDAFGDLRRGGAPGAVEETGEAISLLSRLGELPVLLVAGRQVVTAERIEVLLIGTLDQPRDGIGLEAMLQRAEEQGVLAILPWGLGKWVGRRGTLVAGALARHGNVLAGDIQARVGLTRFAPPKIARAAERRTLDGTDPLPLPGEGERVGSFGQIVTASLDPRAPAAGLIAALRSADTPLEPYGRRQSLVAMARMQWALRGAGREAAA